MMCLWRLLVHLCCYSMALLLNTETFVFSIFSLFYINLNVCWGDVYSSDEHHFQSFDFDVKPGGIIQEHTEHWRGVTCTFTYACQGGTKELWSLSIKKYNDGAQYACSVERPSGESYLFFERFKLEILPVTAMEAVLIGEKGNYLKDIEYKVDGNKVLSTDEFRSHLNKVELAGIVNKQEL